MTPPLHEERAQTSLAAVLRRWGAVWTIGGLAFGAVLAFTDSGHVPAWLAPLIVALFGAAGGALGGLVFYGFARVVPRWSSGPIGLVFAAIAGAAAGGALSILGLGIALRYGFAAGSVLGVISALRRSARASA